MQTLENLRRKARDVPIRRKLTWIMMAVSGTALAAATMAFVAYNNLQSRNALRQNLITLAEVIGQNSTAALAFEDADAAGEILEGLRAQSGIILATLFTADRRPLVQFHLPERGFKAAPPPPPFHKSSVYTSDVLAVYHPIVLEGETVGGVYLVSNLVEMRSHLHRLAGTALLILLCAAGLSYLLASRLHPLISAPILELARAARSISTEKNYAIRVNPSGRDEIGILMEAFNQMLEKIQRRDQQLISYGTRLEEKVAESTAELKASEEHLPLRHLSGFGRGSDSRGQSGRVEVSGCNLRGRRDWQENP
jgi:methyl-accepting chemotaxis protein